MAKTYRGLYVTGQERRPISRPQPPMQDRRIKRQKSRGDAKRAAIKESM